MEDFIGFTYNGKHCIKDFGIYRTSDGSRYNDNLVPSVTDKTADIPGGNGQYFFQATHKNRQFSVSIAFDHLTEQKYREMRTWLDGKEIHDLIFDEAPYKVYSAKVTGTPQLKTLCFDEYNEELRMNQRIYKGEGTIQFTCYWPYAHTPHLQRKDFMIKTLSGEKTLKCNILLSPGDQITNPSHCCTIYYTNLATKTQGSEDLINGATASYLEGDSPYLINSIVCKGDYYEDYLNNSELLNDQEWTIGFRIISSTSEEEWYYTENEQFELVSSNTNTKGKNINCYYESDYPNKKDWMFTSGLSSLPIFGDNFGDLPAPFIVTGKVWKSSFPRNIIVGNCSITLPPPQEDFNLYWDSKSGLVCKVEENGKKVPIPYTGISYGTIPVGTASERNPSGLDGLTLDYDYWYY